MDKWNDNSIQFPRLLAEIMATQDKLDIPALADAMNLDVSDVNELFDRADTAWEAAKAEGRLNVGEDDTRVKRGTFTFTFVFDTDSDPLQAVMGMEISEIFENCDTGSMTGNLVGGLKIENVADPDEAARLLGSQGFFDYIHEEDENNPGLVKDAYDGGVCPDCGKEIPDAAVEGDECGNCGHVFWQTREND